MDAGTSSRRGGVDDLQIFLQRKLRFALNRSHRARDQGIVDDVAEHRRELDADGEFERTALGNDESVVLCLGSRMENTTK